MTRPAPALLLPTLAVTMGDPAGIGPEVALAALYRKPCRCRPILVGDADVFRAAAKTLGLDIGFVGVGERVGRRQLPLYPTTTLAAKYRTPGLPRSRAARSACGESAYAAILGAVELVRAGTAAGIVTAPISKEHVTLAGHDIPGHTELLAELAGGVPVRMMMAGPKLRVVLVTTHLALADVPHRLTVDGIVETIVITARALRERFGCPGPRIAVAGLNPHAGEGGKFGDEEIRIIGPAVRRARRRGIDATGPLAADSIFADAAAGGWDAVVCMYHDQGLGPFKLLHFADGVNVTLGLPFIRTSPDHGTAFDIAGTGKAMFTSMAAALDLAARLAADRSG
jgi:4-hydroxythreonine-4-phosphate dehydrogenase